MLVYSSLGSIHPGDRLVTRLRRESEIQPQQQVHLLHWSLELAALIPFAEPVTLRFVVNGMDIFWVDGYAALHTEFVTAAFFNRFVHVYTSILCGNYVRNSMEQCPTLMEETRAVLFQMEQTATCYHLISSSQRTPLCQVCPLHPSPFLYLSLVLLTSLCALCTGSNFCARMLLWTHGLDLLSNPGAGLFQDRSYHHTLSPLL